MSKLYKRKYTLSNKTLLCRSSHRRLFQKNDIDLDDFDYFKDNPNKIIDSMKDTKGKHLKNGYKAQIAMTLKARHPNLEINIKKYKIKAKKETRVEDPEFIKKIKSLAEDCAKRINLVNEYGLIDLGEYESCLVVIISLATTMRLDEILQMKLRNLKEILEQKMTSISPKGNGQNRFIPLNTILIYLVNTVLNNRNKVESYLRQSNSKLDSKREDKFIVEYVITSSASYLKKKIKELAALASLHIPVLGFKPFRKLTTTVLIDNGGLNIASALNNHKDISTTQEYYNVASGEVVGKIYSFLNNIINNENNIEDSISKDIDKEIDTNKNKDVTEPMETDTTNGSTVFENSKPSTSKGVVSTYLTPTLEESETNLKITGDESNVGNKNLNALDNSFVMNTPVHSHDDKHFVETFNDPHF